MDPQQLNVELHQNFWKKCMGPHSPQAVDFSARYDESLLPAVIETDVSRTSILLLVVHILVLDELVFIVDPPGISGTYP